MDNPIPDLEKEYGIKARSIAKSKYFYIINTGEHLYRLYPFAGEAEKAQHLYKLNRAALQGGAAVCPMLMTKSGEVAAFFEEQPFIITEVPKGVSPEPEGEDFLKTVSVMAVFHRVMRGFVPDTAAELPYAKGMGTLKYIRGIINRKNKLSEIDKIFCENYEHMYMLAEKAAGTLSACGLECTYCYGTPKEENFIMTRQGRVYLTNWTGIRTGHFLGDLAYMVKRYNKKSVRRDIAYEEIISRYACENPLSAAERTALECILDYPEKYIGILKEYYGRRRPFAPLYVKEKLSKEIAAVNSRRT